MHDLIALPVRAITATAFQLAVTLGPLIATALVMQVVTRALDRATYELLGRGMVLATLAWLGVAVHELGHAVFCVLFGHTIEGIRLFSMDRAAGTLGYVRHRWNPDSVYQRVGNFFIGMGPLILGSLVVLAAASVLLGPASVKGLGSSLRSGAGATVELLEPKAVLRSAAITLESLLRSMDLRRWKCWLFVWIAWGVGSNMTLSRSDLWGAASGLRVLVLVVLGFNLAALSVVGRPADILEEFARPGAAVALVMSMALTANLAILGVLKGIRELV